MVAAFLLYVLWFALLHPFIGATAGIFVLLPVAVAGAFLGIRAGAAAGVFAPALNLVLWSASGSPQGDVILRVGPNAIGLVVMLAVGAGFGRMHDLHRRAVATERQLQRLMASAPVILATTDRHGICRYIGGSRLSLFGFTPAGLVGESFLDAERFPQISVAVREALAGRTGEMAIHRNDRDLVVHYAPLENDGIADGMVGVAVDVTDSAQAMDALRQSEQRLHAAAKLPIVIAGLNTDGSIYSLEGAGTRELGIDPGSRDGYSIFDLLGEDSDREGIHRMLMGAPGTVSVEIGGRRVSVVPTTLRDGQDVATGVIAAMSIEHSASLIGARLVERKLLLQSQLEAALAKQRELAKAGHAKRLGEVIVEMGLLTPDDLKNVS